jgi:tungstate transport system ATP-binding protein
MVLNPEVLFLDEPFAALDAPTRQNQLEELGALLDDSGLTALFATHDRGEALALGDRVAVLAGGRVAQVGPAEEVFSRPVGLEVARFLGIETLIPGRVVGEKRGRVQVECGEIRLEAEVDSKPGKEVYVAVRPEEIELCQEDSLVPRGARNVMAGRVTRTVPAETHYRVEMDCGVPLVAVVSRARFRETGVAVGRWMQATFPPGSVHLIGRAGD